MQAYEKDVILDLLTKMWFFQVTLHVLPLR